MSKTLAIAGGGAAGFFAAINAVEMNPALRIVILEKSQHVLQKVKVSGGGRCNVTHNCTEPRELIRHYPRGSRELLGPFHTFQPADMVEWLERKGVSLKTESDGRMFPVTDNSQTIIHCFLHEAQRLGVEVRTGCGIIALQQAASGWELSLTDQSMLHADYLLVATGNGGTMWNLLSKAGHTITEPVPSLFTFNIKDPRIDGLAGVASTLSEVRIEGTKFTASGPVLITHWGLSGPGILKLSAWAARELSSVNYDFIVRVNWDTRLNKESCMENLKEFKAEHNRTQVKSYSAIKIPHRLWCSLLSAHPNILEMNWADVSNKHLEQITEALCSSYFRVTGKSIFKEEFVTAGGVSLKEVDFRTMQSRVLPGLYFAGEVLDVDAVTGGFNFQAAWTTAYIAAQAIARS
ncbi:MAG: NAD(P)/FAD-dependent oxidoreductase [Flavobacteriales bacterium]